MRTDYILKLSLAFLFSVAVLSGCKSDETIIAPDDTPVISLEFPRINSFQEIDVRGMGDWTVTSFPEWAAPMEEQGDSKTAVNLFVETNSSNDDREATVNVRFADGKECAYSILQHGALSDGENGTELTNKNLKETYGVGYTTNVFGVSQTEKYNVNPSSPLNFTKLYKALKAAGESDAMMDEERYLSRIETVTGSSTSAIANQLSINAGIEVGISAFKLSVEGGYSKNSNSNDRYEYAIEEIQHVVGSRQLRPGMLEYFADNNVNIFQSTFNEYRSALEQNPGDTRIMDEILTLYGTHVITQGTLGGELKLSMQMKVTDESAGSNIHAALDLGSKVINASGEFNMSNQEKSIASNTTISLVTYGGDNVYTIAPGATFESFQKTVKDKARLEKWIEKIKNKEQVAIIDMETIPIYELMPSKASREALRNYIVGPYQTRLYSTKDNPYHPDLYVLSGFNNNFDIENECSLTIPEIDVEVVACRTLMKELSADEYSTVIYSGNIGNVGRECGFFVGSSTRKPCKFKRERNGKFTIEEFDRLEAKELTELYVDAGGDITIFPKVATDLYRTLSFTDWKYDVMDLSGFSSSTTIELSHPTVLTGTSKDTIVVQVVLKPQTTLLLSGANLYGNIRCEGDAKIRIAENTVNSINPGLAYSVGIELLEGMAIGPKGSKLTLDGEGSLTVYGVRVGIGAAGNFAGGDIEINSGCLTFNGTPAIGASEDASCGNISINGGKIVARSTASKAAGIGTDRTSTCGDIFVSRKIESLLVYKAIGAISFIGQGGPDSKCGKVTVEDPSKVTEKTFGNI